MGRWGQSSGMFAGSLSLFASIIALLTAILSDEAVLRVAAIAAVVVLAVVAVVGFRDTILHPLKASGRLFSYLARQFPRKLPDVVRLLDEHAGSNVAGAFLRPAQRESFHRDSWPLVAIANILRNQDKYGRFRRRAYSDWRNQLNARLLQGWQPGGKVWPQEVVKYLVDTLFVCLKDASSGSRRHYNNAADAIQILSNVIERLAMETDPACAGFHGALTDQTLAVITAVLPRLETSHPELKSDLRPLLEASLKKKGSIAGPSARIVLMRHWIWPNPTIATKRWCKDFEKLCALELPRLDQVRFLTYGVWCVIDFLSTSFDASSYTAVRDRAIEIVSKLTKLADVATTETETAAKTLQQQLKNCDKEAGQKKDPIEALQRLIDALQRRPVPPQDDVAERPPESEDESAVE